MTRLVFGFIFSLIFAASVFAEGSGGFSGSFLRIGLGARAMAMGNAQVANAADGYGIYYNPAALPTLKDRQFSLSYSDLSLDRNFNFIGLAVPLKPFAGAAVGWVNSGVDNLRSYNSSGQDTGEIDHGLNAFYASFALKVIALAQADHELMNLTTDLISIGVSIKFLKENVDDNEAFNYDGSGFGVDFGVMLKPHKNFSLGYQVKDLNASLTSNTNDIFDRGTEVENGFPVTQKVGVYFQTPLNGLAVAYDFEWSNKGTEKQHIGAEFGNAVAAARLGYDDDHITLGGGLKFTALKKLRMALDYAFLSDSVDEGVSHVFSWRFLF